MKTKKMAALAVSLAIASTCVAGIGSISAFADEVDELVIGMGYANAVTVEVSNETTAQVSVDNITAGQYYVAADLKSVSPTPELGEGEELYVSIMAHVDTDDEYFTTYLSYNEYLKSYIGVVTITEESETIEFSTYSWDVDYTLELGVYLEDLFIGESTYNSISGLQIANGMSRTMELQNVAAQEYFISVGTFYHDEDGVPEGERGNYKLYLQVDNATPVELVLNNNMYGAYTGNVMIPAGAKTITLSTNSAYILEASLSMYEVATIDNEIKMGQLEEFSMYASESFFYVATEDTGYYTISFEAYTVVENEDGEKVAGDPVDNAIFSIVLKTNPNEFSGEDIEVNKYPMYLVNGQKYYFEISYNGIEYEVDENGDIIITDAPMSVMAKFALKTWTKPTVSVYEMVFVPVTLETETAVEVAIDGMAGTTYYVGLVNIPYYVMSVTAHYAGKTYTLDMLNGFNAEIEITADNATIYFTSEYKFVANVGMIYLTPEYDDTIELGVAKTITLRPGESLLYFVYDLPAGDYIIGIEGGNESISVADAYDYTIVEQGNNAGIFEVYVWEEGGTATAYLYFTNHGTTSTTFNVTVIQA